MGGNEGHGGGGAEGDEEEGSHEGHEGDEEEGSHGGHEGDEEEGCDEGHEGDEEEGSHEGYEGDEEEGSNEGHEGDEEEGSNEGHEGHEEKDREQDCQGPHGQGHGAPREQGEDCWRLDCQGLDQEQAWQDRQQEEERLLQEVPMDAGLREGAQGLEADGLCRDQEGLSFVREGEGVLWQLSTNHSLRNEQRQVEAPALGVGISTAVERRGP